jgi:hypothetical protein
MGRLLSDTSARVQYDAELSSGGSGDGNGNGNQAFMRVPYLWQTSIR